MRSNPLILICDDDPIVHESLRLYLDNEKFLCESAFNGQQGLEMFEDDRPDLIVLDLMMPKLNGIDLCGKIRKQSNTPIIMLTAKGEETDRILGLELGADDYIVKPFSPREVIARIKAIFRRLDDMQTGKDSSVVRLPQLEVSLINYVVRINGAPVQFTPKEVEILHMLVSSPGVVLSREQIMARVWGYDYYGDMRTVDAHIKRIRQKLPSENVPWNLATVYGVGYRFEVFV